MVPFLCFLISSCTERYVNSNSPTSYVPQLAPGQAQLTFFWPTGLGDDVTTLVALANNDGQLNLVGTISPGERIVQNLNPGKYTYVIGGLADQLLEASLEANKHYYVRIEAQWIDLLSGFTFVPISPQMLSSHPDLQIGLMACSIVVPNADGENWFAKEYKSLKEKLDHPSQIFVLKATDGFNVPIGGL
ncbi:MAG: hypothetical protein LUC43_09900 [Burkholderiales bacterium]|nr:hypothetical protein [Burkholderiales bacterium]